MAKTEIVKFVVEPDLKRRLVEAAEQERRSYSDLARVIIEDWLTAHGY